MAPPRAKFETEKIPLTAPREIVALWATAFLIVLLLNVGTFCYLHKFPVNRSSWLVRAKWNLVRNLTAPVDTLVIGDSTGNQGVVPSVLAEAFGGRALNLCTFGDLLAAHDVWILEEYLKKFPAPSRVVIVHSLDTWPREPSIEGVAQVPLPFGFWRSRPPALGFDMSDVLKIARYRFLPLYSQNESVAMVVRHPTTNLFHTPFSLREDGFMGEASAQPESVRVDARSAERSLKSFEISQANQAALQALKDLATRHQIPLYIFNGPVFEGLAATKIYRKRYAEWLRAQREGGGTNLRTPLDHPITFSDQEMTNADHVIESAAITFTHALVSAIKNDRAAESSIQPASSPAPR